MMEADFVIGEVQIVQGLDALLRSRNLRLEVSLEVSGCME